MHTHMGVYTLTHTRKESRSSNPVSRYLNATLATMFLKVLKTGLELRTLSALAEGLSSIPRTHMDSLQPSVTPVQGIQYLWPL